jgi:hypothetical protein
MIRPILFCALASVLLHANGFAQAPDKPCKELQVKVDVKLSSQDSNDGKITLTFSKGERYQDFVLFLFGPGKTNKLDFSASEITSLPKGGYSLVIQSKRDAAFCPKQFTLKL